MNEKSLTEQVVEGRDMVGVKNITNAIHPVRGQTIPISFGNKRYTKISPGKSIPIPREIFNKIKNARDVNGQQCFKEVPLSECDSLEVFEVPTSGIAGEDQIDENLITTLKSLAEIKNFDDAARLVEGCGSKKTLMHVMSKFNKMEEIPLEHRKTFSKACIGRLAVLNKR